MAAAAAAALPDAALVAAHLRRHAAVAAGATQADVSADDDAAKCDDGLVRADTQAEGAVAPSVMRAFLTAMGPGSFPRCVALGAAAYAAMALNDRWLVYWLGHQAELGWKGAVVFAATTLLHTVLVVLVSLAFVRGGCRAGVGLHNATVAHLVRAPLLWFERTPSGRILSRFSTDLSQVDIWLGFMLDNNCQVRAAN